ncbi:MAG: hypothetical protein B0D96_10280 [Candidatus Sedimenticola endophacoides]|uniref:LemA family protein n=1 Tax=Candidatus Sedimenticola endophacoides TaxID=2548426 RepID=A0A6N4E0G7_9GAMM|nr:MAG: hypothetical protein B0D94_02915 [Candidatus Sedimenticola endophacoides]OQX34078.1 MAG: hypothetical protein B0D96_10280 [Candidatus Sedimenticola endophacoides]OQX42447.1 MAG: hypothetical protein B0D89_01240 [Candidatus Sedimenticola endophacoides]OQX49276.1 MAG: hypothetical protein B0D87_01205 [Candidatus Sedimenticola endophacoides]PUE00956.1 MAG: hypothetical protein C3L26_04430 [Candidatus Sedimenticola endophacoides]
MEFILPPLALLLVWGIVIYNRLVSDKNRVLQAWSDIDVQLRRRRDLLPKLVDAVNAYAHYERTTLDEITRLRGTAEQSTQPRQLAPLEQAIGSRLHALIAVAEAYPELRASTQYLELLRQLSEVEDQIQFARRFYNGAVRNLNVRIDSFPDLLVARPFGFHPAEFFEVEPALRGAA